MKETSQSTCCVVDHGLFTFFAEKLGEQFDRVLYWSPYDTFAPIVQEAFVGDGLPNVERIMNVWDHIREVDVFCFPDVGFGGMQRALVSLGHAVWGHRGGDVQETNRGLFLKTLRSLGLPVPPHRAITGVTALREYLRGRRNMFVKISKFRGNFETFNFVDWKSSEGDLDYFAYKLGPVKELLAFYVFDAIETDIEDGFDTYNVNGRWPDTVFHAMENKDKSLIGTLQKFADLPEEVRSVADAYGPVLEGYDYRGFFSAEIRIKEDKSYFIDPTCRAASPPMQCLCNLVANLGEIVLAGAHGELVEPKGQSEFAAQAVVTVERDKSDWLVIELEPELRKRMKIGFACGINSRVCVPPTPLKNMVGWLVATGDSIEETVGSLKSDAAKLPAGLHCDVSSLSDLIRQIRSAEEKGMEFTEQPVPDPAIVIDT